MQISNEKDLLDYRTNNILNKDDNFKTIFEIRKCKYDKICDYKEKNNNVIFISLNFLQNEDNLLHFLKTLNEKYVKIPKDNYILSIKHTKNNSNFKNRLYEINLCEYEDIINQKINSEMENFINNLTFIVK